MMAFGLVLGLVLLVAGGDLLVRGSVGLAKRFGLSELLIGIVLVGFGTSTPELMTSVLAARDGLSGIAIGNVVGSNTANILLILGLSALIFPLKVEPAALLRDGPANALAVGAVAVLAFAGVIGPVAGALLVTGLIAYLVITYRMERNAHTPSAEMHRAEAEAVTAQPWFDSLPALLVMTLGGLATILAGAQFLVNAAVELAQSLGVSDAVIGVTIVAVGTSLPELVTSVIAALRRQSDIALGNILGSNIFNIFGILGVSAMIAPLTVPPELLALDLWALIGATAFLLVACMTGWRICRREGGLMLIAYVGYMVLIARNALA